MKTLRIPLVSFTLAASLLAACGGGSGSANAPGGGVTPVSSASKRLTVSYSGTTTLSLRRAQSLAGTAVTVTYNGKTVGNGTLDANGTAAIEIEEDVPAGATVGVTAGGVTATLVLAHNAKDTAVLVHVNGDGTITVSVSGGEQPEASPSPGDPDGSTSLEDSHGDPQDIDENGSALPSNLPVTVVSSCTQITLTPLDAKIAGLRFEQNVEDNDGGSKFKYEGPFTSAMTFPLVSQAARLRIELFDVNGQRLLDVRAQIGAFTQAPGTATPAPCPTASATPH